MPLTTSATVSVLLNPLVLPPSVSFSGPGSVFAGARVSLSGVVSSGATFAWKQTAGPLIVLNNGTTLTPDFVAPAGPVSLSYVLTATNKAGTSATATRTITVVPDDVTVGRVSWTNRQGKGRLGVIITSSAKVSRFRARADSHSAFLPGACAIQRCRGEVWNWGISPCLAAGYPMLGTITLDIALKALATAGGSAVQSPCLPVMVLRRGLEARRPSLWHEKCWWKSVTLSCDPAAPAVSKPEEDTNMPPPPRILIVEDEQILAENIKAYLGRRVLDVRMVSNGEHAVEMLDTFVPDAVVMDYRLPGMNGLDTYTEMSRRQTKWIDCVMITGDPTASLSQRARDRGIRSVLSKPFSFAQLLERLEPPAGARAGEAEGIVDNAAGSS